MKRRAHRHPGTPETAAVDVIVQDATADGSVPSAARVRSWVLAAARDEAHGEVTVRIVDREESADLNRRFRGREGPTNVLSFATGEDWPDVEGEQRPLGDIVVCAPVVREEAAAQAKETDAHWAHMVIHGMLHLMGYDHEAGSDAAVMEARERDLLDGLGFPDPYADEV